MKMIENAEHNSIELDFEGAKPSEQVREVLKAYGFWWFGKERKWCHTLAVDPEFFKDFVEKRIKPLVAAPEVTAENIAAAVSKMSEADKQALLASLMGK